MTNSLESRDVSMEVEMPIPGRIDRCFSTIGCPNDSLEDVLQLAGRFRIRCLELRSLAGRTDLADVLASEPGGLGGVRQRLLAYGVSVRVLGTSFNLVGHQPGHWQELFEFASLADALDVPYLRVFGGGAWGTDLTDSDMMQAVRTIRKWRAERNIRRWRTQILIETHDVFSASKPCVRLIELLGEPIYFIWDSHHTWRLGGEAPAYTWQALAPYIRHVHIKDSIDRASARHPCTYVLPGTGQMPGREVLKALKQGGYQGAVSLEWEKMWHPYLSDLSEALASACTNAWW